MVPTTTDTLGQDRAGQGLAARDHPTPQPGSSQAGDSPKTGHWASPWGQGWAKARPGRGPTCGRGEAWPWLPGTAAAQLGQRHSPKGLERGPGLGTECGYPQLRPGQASERTQAPAAMLFPNPRE